MPDLIQPYGGALKTLLADEERSVDLRRESLELRSWDLSLRQVCDLELLLNGALSPLEGYLCRSAYESVCEQMRLPDGTLWPMPIALDVTEDFASSLSEGDRVVLRHPEGMALAVLTIEDIWKPDFQREARQVFGTTDELHSGVFTLHRRTDPVYLGGAVEGLELPPHHTFKDLRRTPDGLRAHFAKGGWERILGFHARGTLHRLHVELTRKAARDAHVLIHPVVGVSQVGDAATFNRVRCYQALRQHYPEGTMTLSLLPLATRVAGPREAVWHAIIRQNYGCTHFIVGRDHGSPGREGDESKFYEPYAAQELALHHQDELGIRIVPMEELQYVEDEGRYLPRSEVPPGAKVLTLFQSELRRRLREGREIPGWFSFPEVVTELRRAYPPRSGQGFTVFFTGLPGAGKSTLANALVTKLMEIGDRPVTLLDGDIVRKNLSSELGFSKEHRNLNILRIGFVAGEITKNRGVAVCAPIAPHEHVRREIREAIGEVGGFVLVYVNTPLEACESRDRKGMYAKARAGIIKGFTGIDDPYEPPENAEIVVDTSKTSVDDAIQEIIAYLEREGYLRPDA